MMKAKATCALPSKETAIQKPPYMHTRQLGCAQCSRSPGYTTIEGHCLVCGQLASDDIWHHKPEGKYMYTCMYIALEKKNNYKGT